MEPHDVIAIHHLLSDYGHVVDEGEWDRVGDLFTHDAAYDLTDLGLGVFRGSAAIRDFWCDPTTHHPLAHHVTNIVVTEDPDTTVRARSKIICLSDKGSGLSFTYRDIVRRCDDGRWRMGERVIVLRRPPRPAQ